MKTKTATSIEEESVSLVGKNLSITGNISSKHGDIEVMGNVKGDCDVENLTIREDGNVTGNIKAESIKIRGTIIGNIIAGSVKIFSTAKITGDVVYSTLSIEDGADICGNFKREVKKVTTEIKNI